MSRWFTAVLVRGSFVDGSLDGHRIGDLLYRLIEAGSPEQAYEKALDLGRETRDVHTDRDGTAASLKFLGLADLIELSARPLGHGTEVYSQILEEKPLQSLVSKDQLTVFAPDEPPASVAFDGGEIAPR